MNVVVKDEKYDLEERTFSFAVKIIKLLKEIKNTKEHDVIKHQLAKSGTSIGANYEEAQGAFSRDDFKYRISICFREAKETHYWLRIIKELEIIDQNKTGELLQESLEIKKIFGKMAKKVHKREDV